MASLKLVIEKGPRNGETLEFSPRSKIRIGRVVKGNNLPIKDTGISSKHLEIKFNSASGKWLISDLDSSNGTVVNSSKLKPLSPVEILHGDVIIIGELTKIRVEIGEQVNVCMNPRRQAASKRGTDGSNLGENVASREETDNCRNPRKRAAASSRIDLGEDEEAPDMVSKVEVREKDCLNLEKEGFSAVRDLKEEHMEKRAEGNQRGRGRGRPKKASYSEDGNVVVGKSGVRQNVENDMLKPGFGEGFSVVRDSKVENMEKRVEGNRRGRGRGQPKKASNLDDGNVSIGKVGVRQNVENDKLKPGFGVSTRRTRSSKRGDDELLSLGEATPAKRTRRKKNAKDVQESSVTETVLESVNVAEDTKTVGSHGKKEKVVAECSENVRDSIPEEEMNHAVLEKEVPEMVVDLKEQPCEEPVGDASEKNVLDDTKNEQSVEVETPDLEGGPQCVTEHNCNECVVSPLLVEERFCDVLGNDEVLTDGRTEASEIEEGNLVSEANCYGKSKDSDSTIVPDLAKMTLGDWLEFLVDYLPKQIYAKRDEIIEDMRKENARYDDFMLQQQKEKSKLPSAAEKTGN
ncbi:hypothetical protein SOVF_054300 [Spinacia oleracea]|nr:hypothetical protein SOVF_054300 [Spinacia oleracea]